MQIVDLLSEIKNHVHIHGLRNVRIIDYNLTIGTNDDALHLRGCNESGLVVAYVRNLTNINGLVAFENGSKVFYKNSRPEVYIEQHGVYHEQKDTFMRVGKYGNHK